MSENRRLKQHLAVIVIAVARGTVCHIKPGVRFTIWHNDRVPGAPSSGGKTDFFGLQLYLVGKRFKAKRSDGKTFFCLHLFLTKK